MKLNLEIKKIILILFLSSLIGIIFNYINPAGISLIRQEKTLTFASDSLIIPIITPDENEIIDSSKIEKKKTNVKNDSYDNKKKTEPLKKKETAFINNEDEEATNVDSVIQKEEIVSEPKAINLEQAFALFSNGAKFIDARDKSDFDAGHIVNAINLPFYQFEENEFKLKNIVIDETIVTYCNGTDCDLSVMLGNKLTEMGYKKVFIFFGGWWDWVESNYPTTTDGEN